MAELTTQWFPQFTNRINKTELDLDTADMHFWIDKRSAGPQGPQGCRPCTRHRVAASLSSGAVPHRRRPMSASSVSSSRSVPKSSVPLVASVHRPGPGSGGSSQPGSAPQFPRRTPGPIFTRAAHAHLAIPRPHLAYIGSTGSRLRSHNGLGSAVVVDIPMEAGPLMTTSRTDRTISSSGGSLPCQEPAPAALDRFTCGLWASFALASVFVAGTKFYLDFQSSGLEALVLTLLIVIFLLVGCTATICRARVNAQLAAAAAAATASASRSPDNVEPRSPELEVLVVSENLLQIRQQQQQQQQQAQQQQLVEQQRVQSAEPPPPYHIAMLEESPPPAYEKVVP